MSGFFIGRQPIFTPRLKVFGYELRGQPSSKAQKDSPRDEVEISHSVYKAFSDIGLDTLVNEQWAFLHFSHAYLTGDFSLHFSPTRMIVETIPDILIEDELGKALGDLEAAGYQIMIEDVTSLEMVEPFIRESRIIKIDVASLVRPEIAWLSTRFKNRDVRLMASGLETMDDFEFCSRLGFQLFQGRFIYHPNIIGSGTIDLSRVTVLRALAVSADENSDFVQLQKIISQDIAITDRLLRLVNSVYYGTTDTVKSLQQAISMIGRDQLRGWITLILMSTVDDKPVALTSTAVIRAKMCELLARALGQENVEEFFLIGLLSIVDALMDLPMVEVIDKLSLSKELVDGLLHQKGLLGEVLKTVQLYEIGEWESMNGMGIDPDTICDAYIESIRWSVTILSSVKG
ncbi:MAG: EAL and HDOD domain-containing protein [Anaerolineaceae bacterium]